MFINIYTKNVIKDIYTIITNNICPNLQLNESMKILDIIYKSKLLDNHVKSKTTHSVHRTQLKSNMISCSLRSHDTHLIYILYVSTKCEHEFVRIRLGLMKNYILAQ